MVNFSFKRRNDLVTKLNQNDFDVVIIGGGITGAGIAVQSAGSGLKTALIEMQDFAEGTSSRSTKLVHGGIRYLRTFDVDVVRDTVQERARVQRIAPHIPRAAKMLMPIYKDDDATFTPLSAQVAMEIYDQLSGISVNSPYAHRLLNAQGAKEYLPQIKQDKLAALAVYLDYKNNDARLTIDNLKQAFDDGAIAVSHLQATKIEDDGDMKIVTAIDGISQNSVQIHSKMVINAAGPWFDQVARLVDQQHQPKIRGTKGIHLVVDEEVLNVPETVYFDSGHHDGRMIFVIPRFGKTYFGTTDTDYRGDYRNPEVEPADVDYLLSAVNQHFPDTNVTLDDVESSWVGIRPLIGNGDYNGNTQNKKINDTQIKKLSEKIKAYFEHKVSIEQLDQYLASMLSPDKSASQVSRGFQIKLDDGLINVSGGKLTDYRLMAQVAMEHVKKYFQAHWNYSIKLVDSTEYQISGGHFDPTQVESTLERFAKTLETTGLNSKDASKIASLFGSNALKIADYVKTGWRAPGLTLAETSVLSYSLDHEMVVRPIDFLLRRTNYLLFATTRTKQIQEAIITEMSRQLGWDADTEQVMRSEYYRIRDMIQLRQLKENQNDE
ncbi:glycerol-3-phosphate dehydrogenase/oxidase [Fructilactobacillus myrtifloralis]|uniref:Alpha-glycerophosphate oxidase n=1 Tax=Fructilactobacillus myrtifloralis TaxID=2940301 RepID=A0ABY5BS32_9LACO|nr:FAD-dependent oxidoreductase [Fructilactobacillus myrtifloralis]USS85038.1 glycerol-3-phosphate dehydrogenase/oxidase [Fructilactobacillus myrtifloralis]